MRIGLQVPSFTWPGGPAHIAAKLAEIAGAAEDAGFYSLWVMDHFFQIVGVGPPEHDMLECYSTLGYLAAVTRRVKLGPMAVGGVYRHPGILVKTATTLDVLCGGRSYFALGAAWFEGEAKGLGVPFPPLATRFERLEETLQIARLMWSDEDGTYLGKHHHLERTLCRPQPLSRPHPPILIAGGGEKKTLRLVAQYGDACNIYGPPAAVGAKLAILRGHCDALDRDYGAIEKTSLGSVDLSAGKSSAADVITHCKALAAVGVQHAIFNMPNVHEIAPLETFGREIIPAVAGF
jgi:F420-dependent oxidoreductase-like protein